MSEENALQKVSSGIPADLNKASGPTNVSDNKERNEAVLRIDYLESIIEKQATEIKDLKRVISQMQTSIGTTPEDQDWDVEAVLDMRRRNNNREFLIRWKDFDSDADSWVPQKDLNCDEKLAAFFQMQNIRKSLHNDSGGSNDCQSYTDDDEDYEPADVTFPLTNDMNTDKGRRTSNRTSKPPNKLNYANHPSCYECGRSARGANLPDSLGAIFCSMICSQIWEQKIKNM